MLSSDHSLKKPLYNLKVSKVEFFTFDPTERGSVHLSKNNLQLPPGLGVNQLSLDMELAEHQSSGVLERISGMVDDNEVLQMSLTEVITDNKKMLRMTIASVYLNEIDILSNILPYYPELVNFFSSHNILIPFPSEKELFTCLSSLHLASNELLKKYPNAIDGILKIDRLIRDLNLITKAKFKPPTKGGSILDEMDSFNSILNKIREQQSSFITISHGKDDFENFLSSNLLLREYRDVFEVLFKNYNYDVLKEYRERFFELKNEFLALCEKSIQRDPSDLVKKYFDGYLSSFYKQGDQGFDLQAYIHFSYMNNTLKALKAANFLSEENIHLLFESIFNLNFSEKIKHLESLENNLLKMQAIGLVDNNNIASIIQGKSADKSCKERLGGLGLAKLNETDKQMRWGWFCSAMEHYVAQEFKKENVNLKELFDYVKTKRQMIAMAEDVEQPQEFGSLRSKMGWDFYGVNKSVTSQDIYPDLVNLIQMQMASLNWQAATVPKNFNVLMTNKDALFISKCKVDDYNFEFCNIGNLSLAEGCILPDEKIEIARNRNEKIVLIITKTAEINNLDANLQALGRHYFPCLQTKEISENELLSALGELVFHMVRLYPLKRGSASVIECLARGILNYHYPDIEFTNIKLGDKNNLPYDVCAHFIQDPRQYADMFTQAIKMQIQAAHRLAALSYK